MLDLAEMGHLLTSNLRNPVHVIAKEVDDQMCIRDSVWAGLEEDRKNYFFIDVQARGEYPNYAKKEWERQGITVEMTDVYKRQL